MDAPKQDASWPSYAMLNLAVGDESIDLVFMYNNVRFYAGATEENLEGEGDLLDKFNSLKHALDNDEEDCESQVEDWILEALDEILRKQAPTLELENRKPITLLEYFSPTTFAFELVNQGGKLCAVEKKYDPRLYRDSSPRTRIVDVLPNTEAEQDGSDSPGATASSVPGGDGVILRSLLPSVPLVNASEIERIEEGLRPEDMGDIPTKVRHLRNGQAYFFKQGYRDHGHRRELEILSRIGASGEFRHPFQTSRLAGLVMWNTNDAEMSLMGFLLEFIEGETLAWRMENASRAELLKWIGQIEETVRLLHREGIVWGDVKPDNVMINQAGDAVVIDFGGGYNPDYIAPELYQTSEGDLLGLENIRKAMGLRKRKH